MGIGLQAVELSPCHAGLAEPRCKRLLPFSALSACSCSLALSGSGKPLTLGSPLNPTHLRWGCCMHYCGAPDVGGGQLLEGPPAIVGVMHVIARLHLTSFVSEQVIDADHIRHLGVKMEG